MKVEMEKVGNQNDRQREEERTQVDMQEKQTVEVWKAGNSLYGGQAPNSLARALSPRRACGMPCTVPEYFVLYTSYRSASVRPYWGPWTPVPLGPTGPL